jgi:hypothetical protein
MAGDRAIVAVVSEDERALRARLAALEAEVKAESRAKAVAAPRPAPAGTRAPAPDPDAQLGAPRDDLDDELEDLAAPAKRPTRSRGRGRGDDVVDALALARRAADVKEELTRPRAASDKSWLASGALSLFLGPVGWLYAGSFREAAPAALAWLLVGGLAFNIIPAILLMPVLAVLMPLSGIAGVVYALTYNRHGERQRLFDKDRSGSGKKALPRPDDD